VTYEQIRYETKDGILTVTLNRPDKLNAFTGKMLSELLDAMDRADRDDDVRAVVFTGAGRGFCAGADLLGTGPVATGRVQEPTSQDGRLDEMGWVGRWAMMWRGFDKPIVGAINGVAAGAGMSTALACDVRIGTAASRFKSVFIERSLSPDSGLSYFLPRVVGYAAAADIIFTSRTVDAEESLRIGLLNRIVPAEGLLDEAVAYADLMTQWPPMALRMSKRVLQHNTDAELEEALRYESVGLGFARKSPNDVKESMAAFREKRKGVYTGA
jgi:enoyl-CoA hydratase/carnithine racemase